MAIKQIMYTVSALGLEPNTKQDCGVQGDHNVYALEFNIEGTLWNSLQEKVKNGGELNYRFDLYNGEGNKAETEPQLLQGTSIALNVEEWLTRFGGVGKVVLVITHRENEDTNLELYSFPALLQFKNRPTSHEEGKEEVQSLTTLAMRAESAAKEAEQAKDDAEEAKAILENAAIERNVQMVLDGKRSGGSLEILDELSQKVASGDGRAVTSDAVYGYGMLLEEKLKNAIKNEISKTVLKAHPIGSLYWTKSNENPETTFGGKWKQITNKFIFAAGNGYEVGTKGGDYKITLAANQLPAHRHFGLSYKSSDNDIIVSMERTANVPDKAKGFALPYDRANGGQNGVYGPNTVRTGINFITETDKNGQTVETGINKNNLTPINIMPPYEVYYCWERIK